MVTERQAELIGAAYAAGITSQKELANFMAQVTHESSGLTRLNESFIYSRGLFQVPVRSVRNKPVEGEAARLEALQGRPQKLAEMMYGGRMGNDEPGDGYKFRGRGYIQLTGKRNYRAAQNALGIDLINNPDLAATHENAIKLSLWFWKKNVHGVASEDVDLATQIINIGNEGIDQRRKQFADWQNVLTPDFMAGLALGEMRLPIGEELALHKHEARRHHAEVITDGDRGEAVSRLQTHLSELGYNDMQGRPLMIDNDFGRSTYSAVEAFQRDHGLSVDGVAGPKTWAALRDATRTASIHPSCVPSLHAEPVHTSAHVTTSATIPEPALGPLGLNTTDIRVLQEQLNTLGMTDHRGQALPVTGVYDNTTRIAVMGFQSEQGLPVTGLADLATHSLLDARATIAELQARSGDAALDRKESVMTHVKTPASIESGPRPSEPASLRSFSDPSHPQHLLYNDLKDRLPNLSVERLIHLTAECHQRGYQPGWQGSVETTDRVIYLRQDWPPGTQVCVDLQQPVPSVDETMRQVAAHDQQQAQWLQEGQQRTQQPPHL